VEKGGRGNQAAVLPGVLLELLCLAGGRKKERMCISARYLLGNKRGRPKIKEERERRERKGESSQR